MQWPLNTASLTETGGAVTASSTPTTVTGSASTDTKGSWSQLIAATTRDAYGLWVMNREGIDVSGSNRACLVDIGLGAAASEVALVPNILMGHGTGSRQVFVPIFIPANSRVSARCQGKIASQTIELSCLLTGIGGWDRPHSFTRCATYGAVTSGDSTGTQLATPGATNTKGAWTQLTASTDFPIKYIIGLADGPSSNAWNNADALIDFGFGAAASEQVVLGNIPFKDVNQEYGQFVVTGAPCNIPAGARLAARFQASATTDQLRVTMIGVG